MTSTATETATWIAEIDLDGSEMERPFMRVYVEGATESDARAAGERALDKGETLRRVQPLQPILEAIREGIAEGKRYSIAWKHEGRSGPVVVSDLDAMDEQFPPLEDGTPRLIGVPFGSELKFETSLPWTTKAEARRLAKYLGLKLEES